MLLGPFNKYPGTDYETFNYDWIIGKLKELKNSVTAAKASEDAAAASADAAEGFASDAQRAADVATGAGVSLQNSFNQIASNTARLDALTDSVSDTEVNDIRAMFNGDTATGAGVAVRASDILLSFWLNKQHKNLVSQNDLSDGYINTSGNVASASSSYHEQYTANGFTLTPGKTYLYGYIAHMPYPWFNFTTFSNDVGGAANSSTLVDNFTGNNNTHNITLDSGTTKLILCWDVCKPSNNARTGRISMRATNASYSAAAAYSTPFVYEVDDENIKDLDALAFILKNDRSDTIKASSWTNGYYSSGVLQAQSSNLEQYTELTVEAGRKYNVILNISNQKWPSNCWSRYSFFTTADEWCGDKETDTGTVIKNPDGLETTWNIVSSFVVPEGATKVKIQTRTFGNTPGCVLYPEEHHVRNYIMPQEGYIRSINHRGYNWYAPENTFPAFEQSVDAGFRYIETDVRWTSDDVAVLLHDATINRTSNGTGNIHEMTYAQASQYSYGCPTQFGNQYPNTALPKFDEFISWCKQHGVHPYIEIEWGANAGNATKVQGLIEIVREYGMERQVTWISSASDAVKAVISVDPGARVAQIYGEDYTWMGTFSAQTTYQTSKNETFMFIEATNSTLINACIAKNHPYEIWVLNTDTAIKNADPHTNGIESDVLVAKDVLLEP